MFSNTNAEMRHTTAVMLQPILETDTAFDDAKSKHTGIQEPYEHSESSDSDNDSEGTEIMRRKDSHGLDNS